MSMLGISSAYSAYSVSSIYSLNPVSPIKSKQENSGEQNSNISKVDDDINDEAIISDKAKALYESDKSNIENKTSSEQQDNQPGFIKELTQGQKQQISELKARDLEVKVHEQAHIGAAAGLNTSAPSYEYETGPDGKRYAVGGEVNISFVESKDPASNIANAQKMKNAALAPAQPSGQDYSVARHADSIVAQAQKELTQQKMEETTVDNQTTEQTETIGNTAENSGSAIEKPLEESPLTNVTPRISKVPVSGLS